MTNDDEPRHPGYLDEAAVRGELTRVFDTCRDCRKCLDLCDSFPALFRFVDALTEPDAGLLTPDQQDRVGDGCHQCGLCTAGCPFAPGRHERPVDYAATMRRLAAMRLATGQSGIRQRRALQVLKRAPLVGAIGSMAAPWANRLMSGTAQSPTRKALSAATGMSAVRVLPPFARQRFSTWFASRAAAISTATSLSVSNPNRRTVVLFPTCVVEYQEPGIGRDLVRVFEHNDIGCSVAGQVRCCGAPLLHAGDLTGFARSATALVRILAGALRTAEADARISGTGERPVVVVPQPTCATVMRNDYPRHLGGPDAALVAESVVDPCGYLANLPPGRMKTAFEGYVPATVTYHRACHGRGAQDAADSPPDTAGAPELLAAIGTQVTVVRGCSGLGGIWGLSAARDETGQETGRRLGAAVSEAGGETVAGDCHLANSVLTDHSGRSVMHPIQVVARAYGLADD